MSITVGSPIADEQLVQDGHGCARRNHGLLRQLNGAKAEAMSAPATACHQPNAPATSQDPDGTVQQVGASPTPKCAAIGGSGTSAGCNCMLPLSYSRLDVADLIRLAANSNCLTGSPLLSANSLDLCDSECG
ncbi:hypothetical protein J1614_006865 [Plenodomus biglobosus]|nr:hypothetical protein J1614_006865 [Plenodomus biglobosus]